MGKIRNFQDCRVFRYSLYRKFAESWTKPSEISSNSDNLYNYEIINNEIINL